MRYVIGLGNYAMGDDGIGLRVVEHIAGQGLDRDFDAVEVGNNGVQVLTYFTDDTEKLVIVDCADFGGAPGDFTVFSPDEVETRKVAGGVSTHEGDVLKLIALAEQLEQPVPPIRIVAIQPESIAMEMTISPALEARFGDYVDAAIREVQAKL